MHSGKTNLFSAMAKVEFLTLKNEGEYSFGRPISWPPFSNLIPVSLCANVKLLKSDEYNFTEQAVALSVNYHITDNHELRIKFESFIGKAKHLNQYEANFEGSTVTLTELEDFSFSENALQVRYKFSMSKLTAFYLSYGFGGEYENDIAKFGKVNLYKEAFKSKDSHNIFAKVRYHF